MQYFVKILINEYGVVEQTCIFLVNIESIVLLKGM